MAVFDVDFPIDFLSDLLGTDADEICAEALKNAAPILEENMKKALLEDKHDLSGELIDSVKAADPKKAKNGAWIVNVRPTGYSKVNTYTVKRKGGSLRKFEVSNALKMIWLEYGVDGHQPARPFLTRVVNRTRSASMEKMQEVYNRKTGAK